MSFNINSVPSAAAAQAAASQVSRAAPAASAASQPDDSAVHVDMIPSSPPPEVHDAMGVAADSYEKLRQANRHLSFQVDDRTGKLTVEVHDLNGNLLFTVPASKALDIAGGGSLD
jgi:uncharacterized FlaG/YvyC family protein